MNIAVLFSGGKDSNYVIYLAKQKRYSIGCLISIVSENRDSFMFHTPSISAVEEQAAAMEIPIIIIKSKGKKEKELIDLEKAIKIAMNKYQVKGIATGAVESVYQASRIQRICNKFKIECFNPLWQKNQLELLRELIKNNFKIIITGVFAYPFNKTWLGRKINLNFIQEIEQLNKKYKINPAGEGGEYESFVINGPLFKRKLNLSSYKDFGGGYSWWREIKVK